MRVPLAEFLPNLYRFARHLTQDNHLAEDLAQEAMVRAIQGWDATGPDKPLVWLLKVVENLWRDRCRQRQRRPPHESLDNQPIPCPATWKPDRNLEQQDELQRVVAAIQQLPERQRMVMHLLACEALTISEISQVLDITPEAVRSSLSLARKQLRHTLTPEKP